MSDPNFHIDDDVPRYEGCAGIVIAAQGIVWFIVGVMVGASIVMGVK